MILIISAFFCMFCTLINISIINWEATACILPPQGSNSSISTDCGLFEGVSVAGELELALAYNTNTSCLEITVGACRNLTYGDLKKKKCHP